ncbi:MAG: ubiquinol-cytochrome c reductase cytochrome b subunit [Actinomycetota bacterium]|nr:ubiquinol-cytochrome c reductase cytochrome b subunit [Actinomycetota bacterium]
MFDRLFRWVDSRVGASKFARSALNKIFPDNWSFMIGEVALYCLVVLILTGIYLTFFFTPSARTVVYDGSYAPLRGLEMSEAYRSTVRLSFDVRAGLVFRQMHHWAALIFAAAIVAHLFRIFFTGAFRKPRELNWIIGVTLLVLVIFNGFSGYSLPDDLLSGTGLRIAYSIALAVPLAGTWIAFLLFGGEFPSPDILSRLFVLHVLFVPAAIIGLLTVHLAILWRQKHTQFPGPGRTEANIEGSRLWPTYAARSVGLFAGVFAVIAALGGLAQINPIWLYGPFEPSAVTTASQPDWYMGWVEGALRLFPPWRFHVFGYTVSELFLPAVVLPGVTFGLLYLWPFLEARVTRDRVDHHLLDRPRYRPVRTAIGIGALTFYVVLFIAGAQDIGAQKLGVPIPAVTWTLRILVLLLPPLTALLARKLCHDLVRAEEIEEEKEEIRHPRGDEVEPQPPAPPPATTSALRTMVLALAAGAGWLVDRILRRGKVRR